MMFWIKNNKGVYVVLYLKSCIEKCVVWGRLCLLVYVQICGDKNSSCIVDVTFGCEQCFVLKS